MRDIPEGKAALAFTLEHQRKVAELEEEIKLHKDWQEILSGPKRLVIWERTAERLQAALGELRRGVKETP